MPGRGLRFPKTSVIPWLAALCLIPLVAASGESPDKSPAPKSGVLGARKPDATKDSGPPLSSVPGETKADRDARMAWWRDAKFGMFIHWGVFSVPAGYYHGKPLHGEMCNFSEWLMFNAKIPMAEYQRFSREFNPVGFDADAWVRAAADAGMKYIIITAKHHDGFAMFDSKASPWNIVRASPYGKDPLKDLAAACRKHGMKLGFYYSQAQDWNNGGSVWGHFDGETLTPGKKWDKAQERGMDDYIDRVAVPQVRELLANYGPDIPAVIWWDTAFDMNPRRAGKIASLVRALKPGIIMNNRLGGGFPGDTETPENVIPPKGYPGRDWETCMTMNASWGYKRDDRNWKSSKTLVRNLCDIASKGGNYLLNVGPDADGLIPAESLKRLAEVGAWMKTNGAAIYGTGPTPFGDEAGSFNPPGKDGKPVFRPSWKWRATTKAGHIYLILFEWPAGGGFRVPPVPQKITGVTLLADPAAKLTVSQGEKDLTISGLPAQAPDPIASVIDLSL